MKHPIFPLATWRPDKEEPFNLEDSDDILGIARQLIDGNHPGVLTTIDELGRPHARWMATTSFKDFPCLYTLTAPKSRKLAQLKKSPQVNWMFSNADLSMVLNLFGKADLVTDTTTTKRIWREIDDKSHAYFLNMATDRPGMAVIRTQVEFIECCLPKENLFWKSDCDSLATRR